MPVLLIKLTDALDAMQHCLVVALKGHDLNYEPQWEKEGRTEKDSSEFLSSYCII